MSALRWGLLLLLLGLAMPLAARECGDGPVGGGLSASGDALENYECALLARVFCRVAEDRDMGVSADVSTQRTVDWLQRLNKTGSHQNLNWRPVVELAAAEVYRNRERKPGPTYYRAAYSCGLAKRVGAQAAAMVQAFDEAAARCERDHASSGKRSYPNRALRDCLAHAVDRFAPVRK